MRSLSSSTTGIFTCALKTADRGGRNIAFNVLEFAGFRFYQSSQWSSTRSVEWRRGSSIASLSRSEMWLSGNHFDCCATLNTLFNGTGQAKPGVRVPYRGWIGPQVVNALRADDSMATRGSLLRRDPQVDIVLHSAIVWRPVATPATESSDQWSARESQTVLNKTGLAHVFRRHSETEESVALAGLSLCSYC